MRVSLLNYEFDLERVALVEHGQAFSVDEKRRVPVVYVYLTGVGKPVALAGNNRAVFLYMWNGTDLKKKRKKYEVT